MCINGSLFERNEWIIEHNMIKNGDLWNNRQSKCAQGNPSGAPNNPSGV